MIHVTYNIYSYIFDLGNIWHLWVISVKTPLNNTRLLWQSLVQFHLGQSPKAVSDIAAGLAELCPDGGESLFRL